MTPKRKTPRPIIAEDLTRIRYLRSPALSPDEETACFVVETISEDHKKYFTNLWRCRVDGSRTEQLTFGKRSDSSPVYSPDGRWIAFTGKRGDTPGIHLLPTGGGESHPLVEKDGAFTSLVWTPDSKTIICAYRANDPIPGADEKKNAEGTPPKREEPVCRHITRLAYREDGQGFYPQDRFHIWAYNAATGEGRQLTKGRADEVSPAVSPDGRWVVYVTNKRPDPDRDYNYNDLYLVPVKGGTPRRIPTPEGPVIVPSFSPDGKRIAYFGHTDPEGLWGVTPAHLWIVGIKGRPAAKDITPTYDREPMDLTISDSGEGFTFVAPQWTPGGGKLSYLISDTGATLPVQVAARGGTPKPLSQMKCHVQSIAHGRKGKRAIVLYSTAERPAELGVLDLAQPDAGPERITNFNGDLFKEVKVGKPQEVWFGSTGKVRVQGWVLRPPRFNSRRKYPAIVEVHGGPQAQYGYTFFHELQLLAARGYVVFYCNPRGSQGRGVDWAAAIIKNWGTVDYEDVMAGTDWLEKQPYVDSNRIGITGGSYGGYMTNWLVGHTRRYKAAVTQRSVVSLESFVGSSDFGYAWDKEFGGFPWDDLEHYQRMSPLTYAKNIRTPLLIIHSEHDQRCAIEQAERLYATLRILHRTTELVRFPEEPHGLSRHGRPDRRLVRLGHILRWFDKYMKKR